MNWYKMFFLQNLQTTFKHAPSTYRPMFGTNWQLVTYEAIEFEKLPIEVRDLKKITDHFRGIYRRIYLKWMKEKPEDINM